MPPEDLVPKLVRLRRIRKRLSAVCLFLVLTAVIFGVKVLGGLDPALAVVFVVAAALFAWRAYRAPVRAGWA